MDEPTATAATTAANATNTSSTSTPTRKVTPVSVWYQCKTCLILLASGAKTVKHLLQQHSMPFPTITQPIVVKGKMMLAPRPQFAERLEFRESFVRVDKLQFADTLEEEEDLNEFMLPPPPHEQRTELQMPKFEEDNQIEGDGDVGFFGCVDFLEVNKMDCDEEDGNDDVAPVDFLEDEPELEVKEENVKVEEEKLGETTSPFLDRVLGKHNIPEEKEENFKFPEKVGEATSPFLDRVLGKHDIPEVIMSEGELPQPQLGVEFPEPEGGQVTCPQCNGIYSSQHSLAKHLKKHGGEFQCPDCPSNFKQERVLDIHRNRMHPEKLFETYYDCKECKASFTNKPSLKQHSKIHGTAYKCLDCNAGYKTQQGFTMHKNKSHPDSTNYPVVASNDTEGDQSSSLQLECTICGDRFVSKQVLKKHISRHGTTVMCQSCPAGFINQESMNMHHSRMHSIPRIDGVLACPECGIKLKQRCNMKTHRALHGSEFKCPDCPVGYTTQTSLNLHRRKTHDVDIPFIARSRTPKPKPSSTSTYPIGTTKRHYCPQCGNHFKDKHSLATHMKLHGTAFICRDCPAGYRNELAIIRHRKIKHGNLPWEDFEASFRCSQCHAVFSDVHGLAMHMNRHGTEFMCSEGNCGAGYKTERSLKIHMIRCHQVKKEEGWKSEWGLAEDYKCEECGGRYQNQAGLEAHMARHGTAHMCPDCPAGFKGEQGLAMHRARMHTTEKLATSSLTDSGAYECPECKAEYPSLPCLEAHLKRHGKKYMCPECPAGYITEHGAKIHLNKMHPDSTNLPVKGEKIVTPLVHCELCGGKFRSQNGLDNHLKIHGNEHMCPDCPTGFKTSQGLLTHRHNIHPDTIPPTQVDTAELNCSECGAEFGTYHGLQTHLQCHGTTHMCPECPAGYKSEQGLAIHRNRAHAVKFVPGPDGYYSCTKCEAKFSTSPGLGAHMKGHGATFQCPDCPTGFKLFRGILSHRKRTHLELVKQEISAGGYTCLKCNTKFDTKFLLAKHWNRHGTSHKCPNCPAGFKSNSFLHVHRRKAHPDQVKLETPLQPENGEFNCDECSSIFCTKIGLEAHKSRHGSEFMCPYCTTGYKSEHGLAIHKRREHKDKLTNDEKIYLCEECPAKFKHNCNLHTHKKQHGSQFVCPDPDCSVGFKTEPHLAFHIKKYHPLQKPHVCQECGADFKRRQALQLHQKRHGTKFMCGDCNAGFKYENSLSIHRNRAHGVKIEGNVSSDVNIKNQKYPCTLCGAEYKSYRVLKDHLKNHGDGFTCPDCPASFRFQQSVLTHRKKMHKEKVKVELTSQTFTCVQCGEKFRKRHQLVSHVKGHGTQFKCNLCGVGYRQLVSLTIHKKKIHGSIKVLTGKKPGRPQKATSGGQSGGVGGGGGGDENVKKSAKEPDFATPTTFSCHLCTAVVQTRAILEWHLEYRHTIPLDGNGISSLSDIVMRMTEAVMNNQDDQDPPHEDNDDEEEDKKELNYEPPTKIIKAEVFID